MLNNYKIGDIVKGIVTGIEKYGIFVKIDDIYGLIHISEISSDYVKDINEYVKIGETIYCEVINIDEANLQLSLSIKDINYKENLNDMVIKETRKGFLPLKQNLNKWIEEKLKEYNKM